MSDDATRRLRNVTLGEGARVMDFVNAYDCSIGDETLVGPFVEIQEDVRIGRRCKIESHTFVCAGTVIEDGVFVGHHVTFTNDRHPAAVNEDGELKTAGDWKLEPASVGARASIGSGAVILPGVRIGEGAMVGAGAVVTRDVAPGDVVVGNPARPLPRRQASTHVAMFDPVAEHDEIGPEIDAAIAGVVRSGRFIGGPEVDAFEADFSQVVGGRRVAGVANGTDALTLALLALGVGPGDEVILPANTFTATAMAVAAIGAVPVVSDVDESTHVITADLVRPLIGDRTRAILPVHLYGQPANMPELMSLAAEHGLVLLEDAAQAHGAEVGGRAAGAWGDAAAFSYYPSKNLGAYGDAGAVAADDAVIERVRLFRDLGRDPGGNHVVLARNSRLDALQAAILRAKLPHLQDWIERRRALADRYRELLADRDDVVLPAEAPWGGHVYHLLVVRVPDRDGVRERMRAGGIETGIHYPTPIHLQPAHRDLVRTPAGAPVAERLAGEILSLPIYPQLGPEGQARVVETLRRALDHA